MFDCVDSVQTRRGLFRNSSQRDWPVLSRNDEISRVLRLFHANRGMLISNGRYDERSVEVGIACETNSPEHHSIFTGSVDDPNLSHL